MKIYYINSTHWDREWFKSFQEFRFDLVEMVDDLLDIMEKDPAYKRFCFDGQTIVLEDYVKIVPDGEFRLRKLIADGRLLVGPWFVMPDEFLVSGESLIRNLMTGCAIAKKWGGNPWLYGYVNDIFGHIAQMPQIFNGFGIQGSYIGRGLGDAKYSHFVWRGPDGSQCYTTIGNYGSFTRSRMKSFGTPEFPEMLKKHIEVLSSRSDVPIVVFSNTDDHAKATSYTPKVLEMIQELFPDAQLVDADLSHVAEELRKYEAFLPVACGELNTPNAGGHAELLTNCLSSYYPLKQENDYCQNLLEQRIEPLLAVSALEGKPMRHRFVDEAYRYLLENHPHDSICGCSGDQVHKDMIYRYDQVKLICQRLYDRFLEFNPSEPGDYYEFKLYHFTGHSKKAYIHAKIDFFKDYPSVKRGSAGCERRNNFRLYDAQNNEIPYQIVSVERNVSKRILTELQSAASFDIYTICFEADLPAFGFTSYKVVPCKDTVAYPGRLCSGDCWAENALIRLEIRPNGQLDILDKRTGKIYAKLHEFSDDAEVGDGWQNECPINSYTTSGYGSQATISVLNCGFAAVTFLVEKDIMLPAFLDGVSLTRSVQKHPLHIAYTVCLKRDSAAVEVSLKIENNIKDHRLRLMLPTGIEGNQYFAGQAFCCVQREVGVNPATAVWPEPELVEKNMNGIVGKRCSDGSGLAFVSAEGLHECAVHDDADNTIAITLYRCFDRVYLQTNAYRSQLQQKMTFKYAIVPLDKETTYSALLDVQQSIADTDVAISRRVADPSSVATSKSYISLDNEKVHISIFKCAQDNNGYILRLFNTMSETAKTEVQLNFPFKECWLTNLNEENQTELFPVNQQITLCFKSWEIKTLRICC